MKNISVKLLATFVLSCCLGIAHASATTDLLSMPLPGGNVSAKSSGTTFNIQNATGKKFTNISVTTGSGTKIYDGSYTCAANTPGSAAYCPTLSQIAPPNNIRRLIFKFTGDGNKIVAVYVWQYSTDKNISLYVDSSDIMAGWYVKNQMRAKYSKYKTNSDLFKSKLSTLFKNYTDVNGQIDIVKQLGLYFKQQVSNGSITENQFYAQLDKDLSSGAILDKNLLAFVSNTAVKVPNRPSAMSATANPNMMAAANTNEITAAGNSNDSSGSAFCSDTFFDVLTYSSFFANFLPVFGLEISQTLLTGNSALGAVCPSDPTIPDLVDSVNKMKARIDELYTRLDSMNYSVVDLYAQVAKNQTTNIKLLFDTALTNFNNKFDFYNGIFWDISPTSINHKNTTLTDYTKLTVTKPSQFANFYNDNKNFNFRELLNNTGAQIDLFNAILPTDQLAVLSDSLKKTCADAYGITGDVFAERIRCNLIMKETVDNVAASALKFKRMLNDQIDVVGLADTSWVQTANLKFNNGGATWGDAKAQVNSIVNTKLQQVKDTLFGPKGENIFKVLDGFPQALATNMITNHCYTESNIPDPSDLTGKTMMNVKLPGVIEWHTQTPESDPFIVAVCSNGQENNIKSTYHLKNGYTMANILGIMLPYPTKTTEASSIAIPVAADDYSQSTRDKNFYTYTSHKFTFILNFKQLEYNLRVNSSASQSMWRLPLYVPQGVYDRVFAYLDDPYTSGRTYRQSYFTYDSGDFFLQPITPPDDKTLSFQSTVYGLTSNNVMVNTLRIDGKVYLSIQKDDNTYVFGLAIVNNDSENMLTLPHEAVNLECFVGTACSTSGPGLQWPDGTMVYIDTPDSGRTINLVVSNTDSRKM